jgi:hypothetical protein
MTEKMKRLFYPVDDRAQAKKLYSTLLGVDPSSDEAYYVGFVVGGPDVGLDPYAHGQGMTGPA